MLNLLQKMLIYLKPSIWIFGGDGWAYDIGYGGLDHVIASGENVNILVFDTWSILEHGGQASRSTPAGAIAQFAAAGKLARQKEPWKYVAYGLCVCGTVAMGADPALELDGS